MLIFDHAVKILFILTLVKRQIYDMNKWNQTLLDKAPWKTGPTKTTTEFTLLVFYNMNDLATTCLNRTNSQMNITNQLWFIESRVSNLLSKCGLISVYCFILLDWIRWSSFFFFLYLRLYKVQVLKWLNY